MTTGRINQVATRTVTNRLTQHISARQACSRRAPHEHAQAYHAQLREASAATLHTAHEAHAFRMHTHPRNHPQSFAFTAEGSVSPKLRELFCPSGTLSASSPSNQHPPDQHHLKLPCESQLRRRGVYPFKADTTHCASSARPTATNKWSDPAWHVLASLQRTSHTAPRATVQPAQASRTIVAPYELPRAQPFASCLGVGPH